MVTLFLIISIPPKIKLMIKKNIINSSNDASNKAKIN